LSIHIPEFFRQNQQAQLHALMRSAPLATLISNSAAGLQASHLPLLLVADDGEHGTLYGHFARVNPQWQAFAEHGKAVPTWNYQSVHAQGRLELFDEPERLRQLLSCLTDAHESSRPQPWAMSDAPQGYIDSMLRAIVGFVLPIQRLEGQWKLSQNRNSADRAGVQQALSASADVGAQQLAQQIKNMP
jgi:transcriptional regulator